MNNNLQEVAFHPTMREVYIVDERFLGTGSKKIGELVPGWQVELLPMHRGEIAILVRKVGAQYTSMSVNMKKYSQKANSYKIDILGKHTVDNLSHRALSRLTLTNQTEGRNGIPPIPMSMDELRAKWDQLVPPLPKSITAASLYHFLITKLGMTLVTTAQAPGGMITWQRLEKMPGVVVFLWDKRKKQAINNHEIDVGDTHVDVDGMDGSWDDIQANHKEFGYLENKALVAAPARKPYIKKSFAAVLPTAKNIAKNRSKL